MSRGRTVKIKKKWIQRPPDPEVW